MVDTGPGEAPEPSPWLPACKVSTAFRPGQSGLAVRCAGQHDHVDASPRPVLSAFTQLRCLHDDFDAALGRRRWLHLAAAAPFLDVLLDALNRLDARAAPG